MAPVHPGEVLMEEFLRPLAVSQYQLAREIGVPARRINEIVHGQRRISADTALRMARFFGTSERFWINLQSRYDLEVEKTGSATPSTASARSRPPADRQPASAPPVFTGSPAAARRPGGHRAGTPPRSE
jgi:addiction module HigA family antidote